MAKLSVKTAVVRPLQPYLVSAQARNRAAADDDDAFVPSKCVGEESWPQMGKGVGVIW